MAGRFRAGHEKADAVVAAQMVRGDGWVIDVAYGVVAVEALRAGAGTDVEDRGVVDLGVADAVFFFFADLVCSRIVSGLASSSNPPSLRDGSLAQFQRSLLVRK